MAYDAVSAPPPPPARAAAPAAKADTGASQASGQKDGAAAQSPFGALMALLDGAQDNAPAAPQDSKAAQAPATQGGAQTTKPAKTDTKADAKDDAQDADADKTADAAAAQTQGQADPAALMAGLLVPQTTQPAAPTAPQTAQAAADGKAAPTPPVATDATPQLATAETKPDPKLAEVKPGDAKVVDAKPADPTPPAAAKPEAETPPASPPQAALDAAKPKTTEPTAEQRPTTGDVRRADARADARTDQTRDPTVQGPAHPPQQGSQDARNQSGGERPHDHSAEPQVSTPQSKLAAAAPEMSPQAAAPDAAAPASPLAAAPMPQQLASATPAILVQTATPVRGSPETVAQLAAQMIQRLEGQSTQFDLALNPQNLGRVDVRIEIDHRGGLKARMAFDSPEAAKQLSGQQGELRAALEKAGFDLPDGALSFDVSSGGQQQGGGFADGRDSGSARMFQAVADAADPTPATPSYFTRAAASGVDIRI